MTGSMLIGLIYYFNQSIDSPYIKRDSLRFQVCPCLSVVCRVQVSSCVVFPYRVQVWPQFACDLVLHPSIRIDASVLIAVTFRLQMSKHEDLFSLVRKTCSRSSWSVNVFVLSGPITALIVSNPEESTTNIRFSESRLTFRWAPSTSAYSILVSLMQAT